MNQDPAETRDEQPAPPIPRSKSRRVTALAGRLSLFALAFAALIHPLARLTARLDWRVDMLTHFFVPAFALSGLVALLFGLTRRYRIASAYLAIAAVQATLIFRFSGPNPVPPLPHAPTLRILMVNAFMGRINYDEIAALIRREQPDVVGVVEVRQKLVDNLEKTGIHRDFPYRYSHPVGAQGQMIWFREKPIQVEPPTIFAPQGNPVYRATVQLGGHPIRIWLVHPPNPIGRGRERANGDLKALGVAVGRETRNRVVVIGDLNRTEGSPFFDEFVRDSGLRDSRLGFGSQPSWPSTFPFKIPIDQAFVSSDLAVVDRRLGPSIGSDHLPVLIDVSLASISSTADPDPPREATSSTNREAHQPSSSEGPDASPENLARSTARR